MSVSTAPHCVRRGLEIDKGYELKGSNLKVFEQKRLKFNWLKELKTSG